jgi:hypothetical protein
MRLLRAPLMLCPIHVCHSPALWRRTPGRDAHIGKTYVQRSIDTEPTMAKMQTRMDEALARQLIRHKLLECRLPRSRAVDIWAAPGDGQICDGCAEPIAIESADRMRNRDAGLDVDSVP